MSFEISIAHRIGERRIEIDIGSDAPVVALVGPSGAGKTTVLNIVAGLLRPDRGHVAVSGDILGDTETGLSLPPERRRAGYVFQDARLFPHLRVRANLLYGQRLAIPCDRWIKYDDAVDFLGIAHLAERWPATLSGGEARRVAIGRALLSAPRFLLLDEPLTSLDPSRTEGILAVVERIRDELAIPMLYVSHNPAEVARLTDAVVTLGS